MPALPQGRRGMLPAGGVRPAGQLPEAAAGQRKGVRAGGVNNVCWVPTW